MINEEGTASQGLRVFLGLGTNLGDRLRNLREARERIQSLGLKITGASSIYETEPVGYDLQPWFLNQVIEVAVVARVFEAEDLLEALLRIEAEMGRERERGPRVIDIDLLMFGQSVFSKTEIIVPHPRMHLRRFVLEPLCEIAPDLRHPSFERTVREMLVTLDDDSIVRLYN
jgi:2-amino-4-hydroxy-6-hydroxymethyldihydropteridine diphosphokinase